MTEDERALSAALRDLAGRGPSGAPPLGDLVARGRRRRHARTALAGAAGVTGVAVVAALASTGPRAGLTPDTASGVSAASRPSPISLSLAAERTDASPFHYSLTSSTTSGRAGGAGKASTATSQGAFDPSTLRGYATAVGGGQSAQSIRIGDTCYAQPVADGPWLILPCSPPPSSLTTLGDLTQDPAAVLKQLEADGLATYAGRTGSGSDEADVWKFTLTQKPQASTEDGRIEIGFTATGTARVGVAGGQVAAIDYTVTIAPGQILATSVTNISITFSDYGAPVHVSAPSTSEKG
jgi:hypothetical protein